MSQKPHDALFKAVFGQQLHAAGLLKSVLPAGVLPMLDWSSLELQPGSFVDEALRSRHTDLLFSVRGRRRESVLLYVLVEHQSTVDRLMPLRAVIYASRIWARYLDEQPRTVMPPVVYPIVLHHGATPWSAPTRLSEVLSTGTVLDAELAAHIIDLDLVVREIDEASCVALHREGRLTALGALALLVLETARQSEDILADLRRWLGLMRAVLAEPTGVGALTMVVQYIMQVTAASSEALEALLVTGLGPGGEEAFVTGAEQLREQGRQQGLQAGQARVLLKQLHLRFGTVPDAYAQRLQTSTEQDIDRWAERVLGAPTIDDVFSDD
ncbi:MAG: Rpn family recombination-promoting nuclease/putative transposase [Myxococcales bacterium]|nr:Rpn family recombination-promoting nuclease/putative transposase [Myxococcales bacterium]